MRLGMQKVQENYTHFILDIPLFCLLDEQSIHQIFQYLHPVSMEANQVIVTEGDPIDNIYFIVSGQAEVTRKLATVENQQILHIAAVGEGYVIGLSSEGFASRTGLRTATIKAHNSMRLLKISLYDFFQFLRPHQIKYPDLKKLCEEFLLIQALRALDSLGNLSQEKIHTIAKSAKHLSLPSGTKLYSQGEKANACYYVLNGQIITSNLETKVNNTFNATQIFGERELMSNMHRNENAYVKENCDVLMIEYKSIEQFIHNDRTSIFNQLFSKIFGKK